MTSQIPLLKSTAKICTVVDKVVIEYLQDEITLEGDTALLFGRILPHLDGKTALESIAVRACVELADVRRLTDELGRHGVMSLLSPEPLSDGMTSGEEFYRLHRRYAAFLTGFFTRREVSGRDLGRLSQNALYCHEGPTAPIPQELPRSAYRMKVPAGIRKTGELTVFAEKLTFLAKSLLPPPEKWHGLTDQEQRYRQRYVDLFSNPESLEVFLGVCDCGTMSGAARVLGLTQSAVSQTIAELEQRVNASLFDRNVRPLGLTVSGVVLRQRASALLAALHCQRAGARSGRVLRQAPG